MRFSCEKKIIQLEPRYHDNFKSNVNNVNKALNFLSFLYTIIFFVILLKFLKFSYIKKLMFLKNL